jgi:hypothetical protein
MPVTELFDETLDINATENYELSVEVSPHELSFCILDGIRNKFIMLRSSTPENQKKFSPDHLGDLISKDDFLLRKYRKINLVFSSPWFTLVPAALYDPARKDEHFSFNHTAGESNAVLSDKISDPDSFLIFSVRKQYLAQLREHFEGAVPLHHLRPLFLQLHQLKKESSDTYIHADIEADHFTLIVFRKGILQLCNSYLYRNVSDILYHILNVFRNFGISQEETIVLSGLTEQFDDLSSNISAYIRNIKYARYTGTQTFSYVFNDIPVHRYLSLFTSGSCE